MVAENAAVGFFEVLDPGVPVGELGLDFFGRFVVDCHEVIAAEEDEVAVFELGEDFGGFFGDFGVVGEVDVGEVGDAEGSFWFLGVGGEGGGEEEGGGEGGCGGEDASAGYLLAGDLLIGVLLVGGLLVGGRFHDGDFSFGRWGFSWLLRILL